MTRNTSPADVLSRIARRFGKKQCQVAVESSSQLVSAFYWALFCFVLVAILVPIWVVRYPGMVDYPNHLARCYVLSHYFDTPSWSERYALVRTPRPNLAIEMCVVPLLHIFPLQVCGKIFLSISALLFAFGCLGIGRYSCGGPSWLSLPVTFTFFNSALFWGFVNYMFGVGVFLFSFAYWLHVHKRMRFPQLCLCGLLGLTCFFCHLSSFIFFAVACCVISLFEFSREKRIVPLIWKNGWIAAPGLMMLAFMEHGGQIGKLVWQFGLIKLTRLFGPIRTYNIVFDVFVAVVILSSWTILSRKAKISSILIVGLIFALLYLLMPFAMFTGDSVDARFLLPASILIALSIAPKWVKSRKIIFVALLVIMFTRQAVVLWNWEKISVATEHVIAMGDGLPAGARIFAVKPSDESQPASKLARGYIHAIEWWTVSHQADISAFFAYPGQQPLEFRHARCNELRLHSCLAQYDYIWTYHPPEQTYNYIRTVATVKSRWNGVTLWRVADTKP